MKKIIYLLSIFCLFTGMTRLYAQGEESTQFLLSEKVVFSGFGGPFAEFSSVNGEFGVCMGGGGAFMINQTAFIGGYFEGVVTSHYREDLQDIVDIEKPKISFEHGGFWLGYVYKHKKAIHGGLSMKLGWGEIDLIGDDWDNGQDLDYDYSDKIFSIIPQVEAEFNMIRWLKINLGIGYRFISGIDATYMDNQNNEVSYYDPADYNSPVGTVTLLFGGFDKTK